MVPELATWASPGGSQGIQSHRSYLKTTASESEFSHYTGDLDGHWKQRIELEVTSLPSLTVTTHLRNLFLVSNFSFCKSKASGSQKWDGPHTPGLSMYIMYMYMYPLKLKLLLLMLILGSSKVVLYMKKGVTFQSREMSFIIMLLRCVSATKCEHFLNVVDSMNVCLSMQLQ